MTKQFALIAGSLLVIIGALNFFVDAMATKPAHAILHIVAGLLGLALLKKSHRGYTLWVGVIAVILAGVGFAGVEQLTPWVDLPTLFNYVHAVLGIVALLIFFGSKRGSPTPTTPPQTPAATA